MLNVETLMAVLSVFVLRDGLEMVLCTKVNFRKLHRQLRGYVRV